MNYKKQAERVEPLFKNAVTNDDIKMLIKILNKKLDVAIKAEFSFFNGNYTNVNTEEMVETKSNSYEQVGKSKMSLDTAGVVPMSHKIGFSGNDVFPKSANLMKRLAKTDREPLENINYALINKNNSARVEMSSEDSKEQMNIVKEDPKYTEENKDPNKENNFDNANLDAKGDVKLDSFNVDPELNESEEFQIPKERNLKSVSKDLFGSGNFVNIEISDNDGEKSFQVDTNENMNPCNDSPDKNEIDSDEENLKTEPFTVDDFVASDREQQIFDSDNKNSSALNESSEENKDVACRNSLEDSIVSSDEDIIFLSSSFSDVEKQHKKDVDLRKPFQAGLIVVKYRNLKTKPAIDLIIDNLNDNAVDEQIRPEERTESFQKKEGEEENIVAEFGQAGVSDCVEKDTSDEDGETFDQNDDLVKNNFQVQITETIHYGLHPREKSPCKLFGEKCQQQIRDNTVPNDAIQLDTVPETIKCQWNSHLTNRMLAYSVHLRCSELADIYKSWSESTPPILPTKFWRTEKFNSYAMQSIAEDISLICFKCEVVQMKLEEKQQRLKYEEIDKKMQLSFQKESKNSVLQRKLEKSWRKATKTEEIRSHEILTKRKNWFNTFAWFYQRPAISLPRPKTFEKIRR